MTDAQVMAAYAALVEADWMPPKRNGTVDDVRRALAASEAAAKTGRQPTDGAGPGTWKGLAAGLDSYHATNLLEALALVPDTGDWHGALRGACHIALNRDGHQDPNQTAEQMAPRAIALATALTGNEPGHG